MISSINLRNVASYNDKGVQVTDLKKINFIYGTNGCGKTSMTNFLYKPDEIGFVDCSMIWHHNTPIKTIVYNKNFRERNFSKNNIDGVFTLGEATKEDLELINAKLLQLKELKDKGKIKKDTLAKQILDRDDITNKFREEAWQEIYKKHENNFKEAFVGFQRKDAFLTKLIAEFESNTVPLPTFDNLKSKAETVFRQVPALRNRIDIQDSNELIKIENKDIWRKKIIGKLDVNIALLIQKLNINDWVNEGRHYLSDSNICPFCQQETITDQFQDQLANYFDESFTLDIERTKENVANYERLSSNLINWLVQIEQIERANKLTKLDVEVFSSLVKTFTSQIITNKELLHNKVKEPSRSLDMISTQEQLISIEALLIAANLEVDKHNNIVHNYADERKELIRGIWKYVIEESKLRLGNFKTKISGLHKGIDILTLQVEKLRNDYKKLDNDIKNLTKNVTSVQPSINEINKTLISYGFHSFRIVPSEDNPNQYEIQREDGSLVESTLSEGEITFITFLYFLQLAKGGASEDSITEERILIIDDPISSLDSNILFLVSTLIKEIIKDVKKNEGIIKQLILLTHNVYFHKEVSFIDGRTKECSQTSYWILRKNYKHAEIQSFGMKNPIQTSYELLWQELRNRSFNTGVTIQNTMRRIIENYFKILGKYGDDALIKKFGDKQEQEICRSLICWINDGSHSINDDLYVEHQGDVIDKYFAVFKNIFTHTNHLEHYNMMMQEKVEELA